MQVCPSAQSIARALRPGCDRSGGHRRQRRLPRQQFACAGSARWSASHRRPPPPDSPRSTKSTPSPTRPPGAVGHALDGALARAAQLRRRAGQDRIHGRDTESLLDPLGSALSHGCVRVDNGPITWMAHHLPQGTPVRIVGSWARRCVGASFVLADLAQREVLYVAEAQRLALWRRCPSSRRPACQLLARTPRCPQPLVALSSLVILSGADGRRESASRACPCRGPR